MNRAAYLSSMLDLEKPAEREAYDLVRGMISHGHPVWHLLGIRRDGTSLYLAVEWARRGRAAPTYSVVQLRLDDSLTMRSVHAESATAARSALDRQHKS
jgi:hypothetical protein